MPAKFLMLLELNEPSVSFSNFLTDKKNRECRPQKAALILVACLPAFKVRHAIIFHLPLVDIYLLWD